MSPDSLNSDKLGILVSTQSRYALARSVVIEPLEWTKIVRTRTFFVASLAWLLPAPYAHSETARVSGQGLRVCNSIPAPPGSSKCVRLRPGTEIDLTGSIRRDTMGEMYHELITADGAVKGWISQVEVNNSLVVEEPLGHERVRETCNGEPRVGMSEQDTLKTCWGKPRFRRRVGVEGLMRDEWVYGEGRYLYFDNGKLMAIRE
jgi:hypothetical protein